MSRLIVEFGNKFLEWCLTKNAPVTKLMSEAELQAYVQTEYGETGLQELAAQLGRVRKQGTSSIVGLTKRTLLLSNHAGESGHRVATEAEMVARYTA
jgi:hypothetical protein